MTVRPGVYSQAYGVDVASAMPAGREALSPDAPAIPGRWLIVALLACLLCFVPLMVHAELGIRRNLAAAAFAAAGLVLGVVRYRFRDGTTRWRRVTRDVSEDVALFALVSLMGATASYAVAAGTTGWVDAAIHRLDGAIGFDWLSWYRFVAARPSLQIGGALVYASIFLTPIILFVSFALTNQRDAARKFLLWFGGAAGMSLFIFHFLPTLGPLAYLWDGPIPYMPTSGLYQADLIPLLRTHEAGAVDLGALRGLVGPPSFHAASAVLYIAAARHMRRFRLPVVILNVAMLLSIPIEGTHYAIDVIGGIAVALAAIFAVDRIIKAARPARRAGAPADRQAEAAHAHIAG